MEAERGREGGKGVKFFSEKGMEVGELEKGGKRRKGGCRYLEIRKKMNGRRI